MNSGRGSRARSADLVKTMATSNQTTPNDEVTREDLNAIVAGLNRQVEAQNKAMFEKLTALFPAQANPAIHRVETNMEENARSSSSDHHEKDGEFRDKGLGNQNRKSVSNNGNVEDSQANAHGKDQPKEDFQWKQTSQRVDRSNKEAYVSEVIKHVLRENQQRKEDENEWGFIPSKTPFTKRVLGAEFPKKFIPPTIPAYNGTSNPSQFLYKYDWNMSGARATDEVKCRYFPVYLEGVALTWFTKLPVNSIDQFSDLTRKFQNQFRLHASKPKDIMSLFCLEQNPGEPLKAFLNRFNNALAEVENPEPQSILGHLMRAIDKSTKFGEWLKMKEPNTLEKLYKKADEFIRLESAPQATQAAATIMAIGAKDSNNTYGKKDIRGQKRKSDDKGKESKDVKKGRYFRPRDLTPLNDTPKNIYLATKDTVDYPKPPQLRMGKDSASNGKFCLYHNQPGHDTNECRHLKNAIEELVRQNQLQQYVSKS